MPLCFQNPLLVQLPGPRPFTEQAKSDSGEGSTSSTWPPSPSRTARRGAEGTEAGNFRGGPIKGHLSGLSGLSKKKEIKGTVASGAIRSQHVISIKSRRPRRRFSLVPHGERSGRLRSRRPRGSLKFPLPSRRLHASIQLSFLGRRFLRCVATLLLELVFTSSPAHPLRRAYAPTTSSSSSLVGLAWGSRSQGFIEFYDIVYGILSLFEISASVRSSCPCATPPCF